MAYDNHFYSGQDAFVFLYPHYKNKLIPLPATQMQVGISQQKTPIFGAWSYKWDAVAKGQIIVQGELSIVMSQPNLLVEALGTTAQADNPTRDELGGLQPIIDSTKTLAATRKKDLRAEIWGNGKDEGPDPYLYGLSKGHDNERESYPFGRTEYARAKGKPEADYCSHQPFDIVICYGNNPSMRFEDNSKFDYSTWAYTTREYMRMMSTSPNEASQGWAPSRRTVIRNVELMSAGTVLDVSGQPLQETYSFIARDMISPKVSK